MAYDNIYCILSDIEQSSLAFQSLAFYGNASVAALSLRDGRRSLLITINFVTRIDQKIDSLKPFSMASSAVATRSPSPSSTCSYSDLALTLDSRDSKYRSNLSVLGDT
jgi:hypothetical protein